MVNIAQRESSGLLIREPRVRVPSHRTKYVGCDGMVYIHDCESWNCGFESRQSTQKKKRGTTPLFGQVAKR